MLTICEIETLLECIASFGEYFDDYEVLDSAKRKLETMRYKITTSNSDYAKLPKFEEVYKKAYELDRDKMTVATFYECLKELGNFV